jgi:hypothetical protein
MQIGWPTPGRVTVHAEGSYEQAEAHELSGRLEAAFGDLSRKSCMDLGAGPGDSEISEQLLRIPWRRLISVEVFMPYISRLRQKDLEAERHDIHQCRIQDVFEELVAREADVALLTNVLEHMPRREALKLLVRLEEFVGRGVVIFLPLGRLRHVDAESNALERQRSTWKVGELARLGYDVDVYEGYYQLGRTKMAAAWAIKSWQK